MNSDELLLDNKRLRTFNGRLLRLALDNGVTQARLDALASDINAGLPELTEVVRTSQGGPAVEAELQRGLDVANRTIKTQSDVLADIKAEIAALDGVNAVALELETEVADLKTQLAVSNGKIRALAEGAASDGSDAATETVEATVSNVGSVTTRRAPAVNEKTAPKQGAEPKSAAMLRDKFRTARAGRTDGEGSDSVFGKKK